mmetsp:Transcript_76842/g.225555  ORF Transcript_76842/g.225555 Transcript_76842/m.225555 type:complete len:308 (+) Transcript_76842:88-1011(+)
MIHGFTSARTLLAIVLSIWLVCAHRQESSNGLEASLASDQGISEKAPDQGASMSSGPTHSNNKVVPETFVRDGKGAQLSKDFTDALVKFADEARDWVTMVVDYLSRHPMETLDDKDKLLLTSYFGDVSTTPPVYGEIIGHIRKLIHILGNLKLKVVGIQRDFVFTCDLGTLAELPMVWRRSKKGRYIVYLCPHMFDDNYYREEQTRIFIHEASHHAGTMDYDSSGNVASLGIVRGVAKGIWDALMQNDAPASRVYGIDACQRLAQEFPKAARNNADNIAYFIMSMRNKIMNFPTDRRPGIRLSYQRM